MSFKQFTTSIIAVLFILALSADALADTIRLRDGTTIHGQIIAFKDQQFTVLIGAGTRGRRSRMTLNIEDVESIEFDSALSGGTQPAPGAAGISDVVGGGNTNTDTNDNTSPTVDNRPTPTPPPA